jgi:hypothetical protein
MRKGVEGLHFLRKVKKMVITNLFSKGGGAPEN